MSPFARPMPEFEPQAVRIPDSLWTDRRLSERARFLWCLLWLRAETRGRMVRFTYAQLRGLLGASQSSLVNCIRELEETRWLLVNLVGRYTVELQACWALPSKQFVFLPIDILRDRDLPYAARWVWGVIQRLGPGYTYRQLMAITGYCHNSLIKYIRVLQDQGWLGREARRQNRRKVFDGAVKNPPEDGRQEALQDFERAMRAAAQRKGYSFGQFLMARMVELLTQAQIVENGAPNFLDNRRTGGRMEIDLLLTAHAVAMEFQGLQHKMPTELYPGEERLKAQQERDELKRQLLSKAGLKLIEVWPDQLSFGHLKKELTAAKVPLTPIPDAMRYVYLTLMQFAREYREAVVRHVALRGV